MKLANRTDRVAAVAICIALGVGLFFWTNARQKARRGYEVTVFVAMQNFHETELLGLDAMPGNRNTAELAARIRETAVLVSDSNQDIMLYWERGYLFVLQYVKTDQRYKQQAWRDSWSITHLGPLPESVGIES